MEEWGGRNLGRLQMSDTGKQGILEAFSVGNIRSIYLGCDEFDILTQVEMMSSLRLEVWACKCRFENQEE